MSPSVPIRGDDALENLRGGDGYPVRRRNVRARLAPAAGMFPMRQRADRYGADRNEAVTST